MFNEQELELINVVLSQVQFRAGQSEQMKLVEGIIKKITETNKKEE